MKTTFKFFLFALVITLFSCEDENNRASVELGEWNLTSYIQDGDDLIGTDTSPINEFQNGQIVQIGTETHTISGKISFSENGRVKITLRVVATSTLGDTLDDSVSIDGDYQLTEGESILGMDLSTETDSGQMISQRVFGSASFTNVTFDFNGIVTHENGDIESTMMSASR